MKFELHLLELEGQVERVHLGGAESRTFVVYSWLLRRHALIATVSEIHGSEPEQGARGGRTITAKSHSFLWWSEGR